MIHAFDDLAPDRVLAIKPGRIIEANEELAVGAVGISGAGGRHCAALMAARGKLRLDVGQVRATRSGARGVAGLRHEAGDHPMERHAVVKTSAGKLLDARHVIGRQLGLQCDHHRPAFELQDQGILGIKCHYFISLQRLIKAWAMVGVVKGVTSPPRNAISLTSRDAMAWWRGSAIRNTVSISVLRRWFIATIWNSYSKSDTALKPRIITDAPTLSAYFTSSMSKARTSIVARPFARGAASLSSICLRSSSVNSGSLAGLVATPITRWSTSLTARAMMSRCPSVTGSKVPG